MNLTKVYLSFKVVHLIYNTLNNQNLYYKPGYYNTVLCDYKNEINEYWKEFGQLVEVIGLEEFPKKLLLSSLRSKQ